MYRLFVYTWNGVLNDYTDGCISVIARNVDEARNAATAELSNSDSPYDAIIGPYDGDLHTINNTDPDVAELTIPYVFTAKGSA
jgi:hypothetical protein